MTEKGYLTISVDDGHPTDLRAAELLAKYGFEATFYVPARNPERPVMEPQEIREIAARFEMGSHTFNHRPLKRASRDEARAEIGDGKKWLEDVTGKQAVSFCYPQGKFNGTTVELVEQAGFLGARTCMFNLSGYPKSPFLWGVSTHAYNHSAATQVRHALLEKNLRGVANFALVHRLARDWAEHFLHAVTFVERCGGVAHLYFHSWEIDEQSQWGKLESLLKFIAPRETLVRARNGDLFSRRNGNGSDTASGRA
jgi:peptidoglycan-N-acetylglucosamine deacetylase